MPLALGRWDGLCLRRGLCPTNHIQFISFARKCYVLGQLPREAEFYTYGFDWNHDGLTWWMVNPVTGKKIILWDYQGSQRGIPQHQSYYRMNFWHTNNWGVETNLNAIEPLMHPYEMEVDWMLYDPFKNLTFDPPVQ